MDEKDRNCILDIDGMLTILPFGKSKLLQLIKAGVLPVTKVGKSYLTTESLLNSWVNDNIGKTIYY